MQALQSTLKLFDIPLWLERSALDNAPAAVSIPQNIILVAEHKNEFSDAHREQLSKILTFLGVSEYQLIHRDLNIDFDSIKLIINFGCDHVNLPASISACKTLSISAMLKDPSCKRLVLNDLKPFKDKIAAAH